MPAASPPITTSRSVTRAALGGARRRAARDRGSRDGRGRAGEGPFGFVDEAVHELGGRDDVVDCPDALTGRVALAVGVDPGGVVTERQMHEAPHGRHADLFGERLELLGVLLVVLGGCLLYTSPSPRD